jgi:TATA-binding protein-associated factor Taf7
MLATKSIFMNTKKTQEEIRALGKKLLDELKQKGPNLDRVGKTFVKLGSNNPSNMSDIEDDPLSEARKFRKLKIDINKEFGNKKS